MNFNILQFESAGKRYQATGEGDLRTRALHVVNPGSDTVLCRLVETAWNHGPEALLNSLVSRRGANFVDQHGYAFSEEDGSLTEGVTTWYFHDEQELSYDQFRGYVLAYTRAVQAKLQPQKLSFWDDLHPEIQAALGGEG